MITTTLLGDLLVKAKAAPANTFAWSEYPKGIYILARNSKSPYALLQARNGILCVPCVDDSHSIQGIDPSHPLAAFIAAASPDVVIALVERVKELEAEVATARERLGPAGYKIIQERDDLRSRLSIAEEAL